MTKTRIVVDTDDATKRKLRTLAGMQNMSMSDYIRLMINREWSRAWARGEVGEAEAERLEADG
jgi:hypothetical protein